MRAVKSTHTDTNSAFQNERQKVACNELPETPRRLWCHHEPSDIAQVLHTIADISCHQAYGNDVGFICSKLKIYQKKKITEFYNNKCDYSAQTDKTANQHTDIIVLPIITQL